jgi:transposase
MSNVESNLSPREEKGLQIASTRRIKKAGKLWVVPSQSHGGSYVVDPKAHSCTCPDFETRGCTCKHQYAVEFTRHRVLRSDGTILTTDTVRVTYTQDWPSYNAAQTQEKEVVEALLKGLCDGITQPQQTGRGRPRLPLSDIVFGNVMKTYSTWSGRRASTDIRDCREKGHITCNPHYNTLFLHMEQPELAPLLKTLIEESTQPLRAVETTFAVDSTGFSTSVYNRWFDHKYGREMKKAKYLKAHYAVGTVTNIVTAVEVTQGDVADCPELPGLVKTTAKHFDVIDVSADKAYLSYGNLDAIAELGAVPYIPFKINSTSDGSKQWRKLWHLFNYKKDEFLEHYHQRSNVECTFSAVKRKLGGAVRSKTYAAQVNEILCKTLAYNLTVLVHEMFELGIDPVFWQAA